MNTLHGKHILLTRTIQQNKITAKLVSHLGASPVFFPCLQIEYLPHHIQPALRTLSSAPKRTTDIIFSSSNGVAAVASQLADMAQCFAGFRLVAVGRKTATALASHHLSADIIPNDASQKGLIEAYKTKALPKQAFFFRAEQGNDDLSTALTAKQVDMTLIPTYRSVCVTERNEQVIQQLQSNNIDAVLLGSSRVAQFYLHKVNSLKLANAPVIIAISPQVAEAADKLGLEVQVIAKQPSFAAMLDGLADYFSKIV